MGRGALVSLLWLAIALPSMASLAEQLASLAPPSQYGDSRHLSTPFLQALTDNKEKLPLLVKQGKLREVFGSNSPKALTIRAYVLAKKERDKSVSCLIKAMAAQRQNLAKAPVAALTPLARGETGVLLWYLKETSLDGVALKKLAAAVNEANVEYATVHPSFRQSAQWLQRRLLYLTFVASLAAREKEETPFLDLYSSLKLLRSAPLLRDLAFPFYESVLSEFTLRHGKEKLPSEEVMTRSFKERVATLAEAGNDLATGIGFAVRSFRSRPPKSLPEALAKWQKDCLKNLSTARRAYWQLYLEECAVFPRPDFRARAIKLVCNIFRLQKLMEAEGSPTNAELGPGFEEASLRAHSLAILGSLAVSHRMNAPFKSSAIESESVLLEAGLAWLDCPFNHSWLKNRQWLFIEDKLNPHKAISLLISTCHKRASGETDEYLKLGRLTFESIISELNVERDKVRRRTLVLALRRLCRHRWPLLCQMNKFEELLPETQWVKNFVKPVINKFGPLAPLSHRILWTLSLLCQLDFANVKDDDNGRDLLYPEIETVFAYTDLVILRHHCRAVLAGKRLSLQ